MLSMEHSRETVTLSLNLNEQKINGFWEVISELLELRVVTGMG
jgi:hypothetical protein